jgi:hypothetical protein
MKYSEESKKERAKKGPAKASKKLKLDTFSTSKTKELERKSAASNRPRGTQKSTLTAPLPSKRKKAPDGSRPSVKSTRKEKGCDRSRGPGAVGKGNKSRLMENKDDIDDISYYQSFVNPVVYLSDYPSERYADYASQCVADMQETKIEKRGQATGKRDCDGAGIEEPGDARGNDVKSDKPRAVTNASFGSDAIDSSEKERKKSEKLQAYKLNGALSLLKKIPKRGTNPVSPNQFEDAEETHPYCFVPSSSLVTHKCGQTPIQGYPSLQKYPVFQRQEIVDIQPELPQKPRPLRHHQQNELRSTPIPTLLTGATVGRRTTTTIAAAGASASSPGTPVQTHAISCQQVVPSHCATTTTEQSAHPLVQSSLPSPHHFAQMHLQPQLVQTNGDRKIFSLPHGATSRNVPSIHQTGLSNPELQQLPHGHHHHDGIAIPQPAGQQLKPQHQLSQDQQTQWKYLQQQVVPLPAGQGLHQWQGQPGQTQRRDQHQQIPQLASLMALAQVHYQLPHRSYLPQSTPASTQQHQPTQQQPPQQQPPKQQHAPLDNLLQIVQQPTQQEQPTHQQPPLAQPQHARLDNPPQMVQHSTQQQQPMQQQPPQQQHVPPDYSQQMLQQSTQQKQPMHQEPPHQQPQQPQPPHQGPPQPQRARLDNPPQMVLQSTLQQRPMQQQPRQQQPPQPWHAPLDNPPQILQQCQARQPELLKQQAPAEQIPGKLAPPSEGHAQQACQPEEPYHYLKSTQQGPAQPTLVQNGDPQHTDANQEQDDKPECTRVLPHWEHDR